MEQPDAILFEPSRQCGIRTVEPVNPSVRSFPSGSYRQFPPLAVVQDDMAATGFPENRENNREFFNFRPADFLPSTHVQTEFSKIILPE
jgi:hypothetical protein